MNFRFLALNSSHEVVRGTIYASSRAEAEYKIANDGLELQLLQEISDYPRVKNSWWKKVCSFFCQRRITSKFKQQFFQEMYILLNSGVNVEQALQIVGNGHPRSSKEYNICIQLLYSIRSGRSLSDAMGTLLPNFSYMEINVVRAAEQIGGLEESMKQLTEAAQNIDKIKNKCYLAMIYPCIVLVVTMFVVMILSMVVIPQFQELFLSQQNYELPFLTRVVMNICAVIRQCGGVSVLSLFALILGWKIFSLKKRSLFWQEKLLFRVPIIGKIVNDYSLYLFTSILSMLLFYGITLQKGIEIARNVVSNPKLRKRISDALNSIHYGDSISHSLSFVFSKLSTGIIAAGEQSGKLAEAFNEIAKNYHQSLVSRLMVLTSLIKPILIIFIAILVGVVVIAIFLPMMDLMQGLRV